MVLVAQSASYRGKMYRLHFNFSLPAAQRWKPRCSALPLIVSFLLLPIRGTKTNCLRVHNLLSSRQTFLALFLLKVALTL